MFTRIRGRLSVDGTWLSFMVVTFLSGVGAALFVPTLSLFLTEDVGGKPTRGRLFLYLQCIGRDPGQSAFSATLRIGRAAVGS